MPMKFLPFLLLFFLFIACDFFKSETPVLAQVGISRLTKAKVKKMVPVWDSLDAQTQAEFLTHWINDELFYNEAKKLKIEENEDIAFQLEEAKRKIIVHAFLNQITDTVQISEAEVLKYYKSHPENFLYGSYKFSGFILAYPDWKTASDYNKAKKNTIFSEIPKTDYRIKTITPFDTILETPDSCIAENLRVLEIGKLSKLKLCDKRLKNIVVLSVTDSSALKPFSVVKEEATLQALLEKRNQVKESFLEQAKKNNPVFTEWTPRLKE